VNGDGDDGLEMHNVFSGNNGVTMGQNPLAVKRELPSGEVAGDYFRSMRARNAAEI
jgi:hypothetical protein